MYRCLVTFILLAPISIFAKCYVGNSVVVVDDVVNESFTGMVTCKENPGNPKLTILSRYLKGILVEEVMDSPERKETRRYSPNSAQRMLHGKQHDFFPGSDRIWREENFENGIKSGIQIEYYKNGQVKEKLFFALIKGENYSSEVAFIKYSESGALQFIKCSKHESQTLDPKSCGFKGKSSLEISDEGTHAKRKLVFQNGSLISSTEDLSFEYYLQRIGERRKDVFFQDIKGFAQPSKVLISTIASRKKLQFYFKDGTLARELDQLENEVADGVDVTFSEDKKKLREVFFKEGVPQYAISWWLNGNKKYEFKYSNDLIEYKDFWDNGNEKSSGIWSLALWIDKKYLKDHLTSIFLDKDGIYLGEGRSCVAENGVSKEWSRDGHKEFEGTFKDGVSIGWHRFYNGENGQIKFEEFYKENEKSSFISERKNYKNGQLISHIHYNSDGSEKK
jgi:antitoxin component YwqK of YwqJK toxin-antitoxin module